MTTKQIAELSTTAESPLSFAQGVIEQTRMDISQQICKRCREDGQPVFVAGVWKHEDRRCDAEEVWAAVLNVSAQY